jgi:hypothetical protein
LISLLTANWARQQSARAVVSVFETGQTPRFPGKMPTTNE